MTTSAPALSTHYVPSGRIAWQAPVKLVVYGGIAAAVLAAIYSLVIRYNPLIFFSCIATFIFGACLGLAAAMASEAGLSRSRPFNLFAGLFVAALGLWLHWVMWTWLTYEDGGDAARHLATSGPSGWIDFFNYTADHRHVSVGRLTRSARAEESPEFMLWTWGLEALGVTLISVLVASFSMNAKAFSEKSLQWAAIDWEGELPLDMTPPLKSPQLEQRIDQQGVEWLIALRAAGVVDDQVPGVALGVTCTSAPGDPTCAFVTLGNVERSMHKGKLRKLTHTLVRNRRVEPAAYARLLAALKPAPDQA